MIESVPLSSSSSYDVHPTSAAMVRSRTSVSPSAIRPPLSGTVTRTSSIELRGRLLNQAIWLPARFPRCLCPSFCATAQTCLVVNEPHLLVRTGGHDDDGLPLFRVVEQLPAVTDDSADDASQRVPAGRVDRVG